MASSKRYRRQVKYVLIKKSNQFWKRWFSTNRNKVNPISVLPPIASVEFE